MLFGLILVVHILVSLVLIGVVLLQGGRGGLSEALGGAAAQSLFGSSAKTVLTRMTTFCAAIFVVTCLSLAYLSTARGRSVIEQVPLITPETLPATLPSVLPIPTEEPPPQPDEPHPTTPATSETIPSP